VAAPVGGLSPWPRERLPLVCTFFSLTNTFNGKVPTLPISSLLCVQNYFPSSRSFAYTSFTFPGQFVSVYIDQVRSNSPVPFLRLLCLSSPLASVGTVFSVASSARFVLFSQSTFLAPQGHLCPTTTVSDTSMDFSLCSFSPSRSKPDSHPNDLLRVRRV